VGYRGAIPKVRFGTTDLEVTRLDEASRRFSDEYTGDKV
jgi:hypothetical protein